MVAVELILLVYFFYVVGYSLTFAIAGYGYRNPQTVNTSFYSNFAVLIPSYKEDSVIVDVARQAIQQDYPQDHFRVFIIADSLKPETVDQLKALPLSVVEVVFVSSTKVKSLIHAL